MLLHSHAGEIHLLPALPKAWVTGTFRVRIQGANETSEVRLVAGQPYSWPH